MASSHNDGAVRDTVDGCSPQPVGEGRKCSTEGVPELGVQDKETAAGKREKNVRGLACTKTGSTLGNCKLSRSKVGLRWEIRSQRKADTQFLPYKAIGVL